MKRLFVPLACLSVFGFAGGAMAAPPLKATILHCGCVLDPADQPGMAYVQISVSSKAKGHLNHDADTLDSCVMADGVTLVDFVRTGGDCRLSDLPPGGLGDLGQCDPTTQAVTLPCGARVETQQ